MERTVTVKDGTHCRSFAAAPDMPAHLLCAQVAAWLGAAEVRLSLGGRILEGEESLMAYGVQRNSVIHALSCWRRRRG